MLRLEHNIKILCRVLRVNRSSYYKHFSEKLAPRVKENQDIKVKILELYAASDKRLSGNKIKERLQAVYGINISAGRVYRLMSSMSLPKMSTVKPKFTPHKDDNSPCENKLKQNFTQNMPNLAWVSDITYVKVANRWNYLCVVIDLFSRKIIGYAISGRINRHLVIAAVKAAYKNRGCPSSVLFHSDRGSQYTSKDVRKLLDELHFIQSFSKKGYPYDNAVAESFFKYYKLEEANRRNYQTIKDFELAVFAYIEGYYNSNRPHTTNANLTPNEKEEKYRLSTMHQ